MLAVQEGLLRVAGGGILYDASRLRKPGSGAVRHRALAARGLVAGDTGGRASIAIVSAGRNAGCCGTIAAAGSSLGFHATATSGSARRARARSRSGACWRNCAAGACRSRAGRRALCRSALTYRADLITEHLPNTRTLADAITGAQLPRESGEAVGRRSRVSSRGRAPRRSQRAQHPARPGLRAGLLLDFDRGRIEARRRVGAGRAGLRRSLEKIRGSARCRVRRRTVELVAGRWLATYRFGSSGSLQSVP